MCRKAGGDSEHVYLLPSSKAGSGSWSRSWRSPSELRFSPWLWVPGDAKSGSRLLPVINVNWTREDSGYCLKDFPAVVVAQLVERSLPTPEVRGSNPFTGKIHITNLPSTVWKDQNKENEAGIGHIKRSLFCPIIWLNYSLTFLMTQYKLLLSTTVHAIGRPPACSL